MTTTDPIKSAGYNKLIVSGDVVELYNYEYECVRAERRPDDKSKFVGVSDLYPKKTQEQKFQMSANRARNNLRRIIDSNQDFDKFITLTFAENVTDLKQANYDFNQFIKRLSYSYKGLKYVAVPEFQKRGAVHYHMLSNLSFLPNTVLRSIWSHGYVKINRIKDVSSVASYVSKYLSKDFDLRLYGKKRYFCSRNVLRPVEWIGEYAVSLYGAICSYLEFKFYSVYNSNWSGCVMYTKAKLLRNFADLLVDRYSLPCG